MLDRKYARPLSRQFADLQGRLAGIPTRAQRLAVGEPDPPETVHPDPSVVRVSGGPDGTASFWPTRRMIELFT